MSVCYYDMFQNKIMRAKVDADKLLHNPRCLSFGAHIDFFEKVKASILWRYLWETTVVTKQCILLVSFICLILFFVLY